MDLNMLNVNHPRSSFLRRLKSIPVFNGDTYNNMRDFVDIVDTLYMTILDELEENEFYDQLFLQIRGEARNAIKNIDQTDWETVKRELLKYFSHLANNDIINSKLENLRQEENESLDVYSERVRKLLHEKNSIYEGLTEEQKLEHDGMARKFFVKGVSNNRLRDRLLIRRAISLEDVIANAIEIENDLVNQLQNDEIICGYCKLTNHREKDCKKKVADETDELIRLMAEGLK